MHFRTNGAKGCSNFSNLLEIVWIISHYFLPAAGYTSTVTKNSTGVTSTLKVTSIPVEKHGSHKVTVTTNGGDAISTLKLYVIGESVQLWRMF